MFQTAALQVTALYAGLLGIMCIVLAFLPGRLRGSSGVSIGDGGNPELLLAMRRHANFIEFVPLILILMGILEINGVSSTAIHVMGAGLVVARICHAVGIKADTMQSLPRGIGAGGSTLIMLVASVWAIITFF